MSSLSASLSSLGNILEKVSESANKDAASISEEAVKKTIDGLGNLSLVQKKVAESSLKAMMEARKRVEELEKELESLDKMAADIKESINLDDAKISKVKNAIKKGVITREDAQKRVDQSYDKSRDISSKIDELTAERDRYKSIADKEKGMGKVMAKKEFRAIQRKIDEAEKERDELSKQAKEFEDLRNFIDDLGGSLQDLTDTVKELNDIEEDRESALKSKKSAEKRERSVQRRESRNLADKGVNVDPKELTDKASETEKALFEKYGAKGKGGQTAVKGLEFMKGLKGNIYFMIADAIVSALINAVEWGIGKSTEYMVRSYQNMMKTLEADMTVTMNNMRVGLTAWKDAMQGAYEAQSVTAENAMTMLDAQNEVALANLKLEHTWTNWIPVLKQINEMSEKEFEMEWQLQKLRIQMASKNLEMVQKYTAQTDEFIKKFDKVIHDFQISQGLTSVQTDMFRNRMIEMNGLIAEYGETVEGVMKIQKQYNEQSGRLRNFSNRDYEYMAAGSRIFGADAIANFSAQMEIFNHSVSDSAEIMFDMYKDANKMGIAQQKLVKNVLANLKLANKYDFKNGTKGFIELAKWAENARFNLNSLGSAIEKVQSGGLEGTITQAAKLQVLGGDFARLSNPLEMTFEAFNNPDEYAKRIAGMFENMGRFNEKTGETEFNEFEHRLIRSAAETLGIDVADAKNIARGASQFNRVKSQMQRGLDETTMREISNRAFRDENGNWYVNTIGGGKVNVSDIGKNFDMSKIETGNTEKDMLSYAKETLDVEKRSGWATERINEMLGGGTYDNYLENLNKSINTEHDFFKKNLDELTKGMNKYRDETVEMEGRVLKESIEGWENVAGNMDLINKAQRELSKLQKEMLEGLEGKLKTIDNANEKINENAKKMSDEGFFALTGDGTGRRAQAAVHYAEAEKAEASGNPILSYIHKGIGLANSAVGELNDLPGLKWGNILKSTLGHANVATELLINAADYADWYRINSEYRARNNTSAGPVNEAGVKDGFISSNGRPMYVEASNVTPIQDGATKFAKSDKNDSAIFAKTGGPFDTLFNSVFTKVDDIYNYIGGDSHTNSSKSIFGGDNSPLSILNSIDGDSYDNSSKSIIGGNNSLPSILNNIGGNSYSNSSESVIGGNNSLSSILSSYIGGNSYADSSKSIIGGDNSPLSILNSIGGNSSLRSVSSSVNSVFSPLNGSDNVGEAVIMSSGGKASSSSVSSSKMNLSINGKIELTGQNGQSVDILSVLRNNPMFVNKLTEMIVLQMNSNVHGGRTEPFHNRFASTT